jgi:hydroxyacylglutathione hydrolase
MDVRTFTVGPVQENCHIARRDGAREAVVIDPGDEAERLLEAIAALDLEVAAILLTHTHFDHVGAVAPVARATGAEVWCPEIEAPVLADIMRYVPWDGFGPFESYDADHLVAGGETLQLAGLDIEVLFTPGHSPGHVTYSIPSEQAVFSGDVLFAGSIGRTDLPGGDHATLMRTLASLAETLPDETVVYPGHMQTTTIGRERASNPFLQQLAARPTTVDP